MADALARTRYASPRRPDVQQARLAGLLLAAFVGLWSVTHLTDLGQRLDDTGLDLLEPWHEAYEGRAELVRTWGPVISAAVAGTLGLLAVVRRRWRALIPVAAVPLGCVVVAEALKIVLPRPELGDAGYGYGFMQNSFPSSNVAVVCGLWIGAWLLGTRHRGLLVVSGVVFTTSTVVASMVTYAHRPSDVVGGVLLAFVALAVTGGRGTPQSPIRPITLRIGKVQVK